MGWGEKSSSSQFHHRAGEEEEEGEEEAGPGRRDSDALSRCLKWEVAQTGDGEEPLSAQDVRTQGAAQQTGEADLRLLFLHSLFFFFLN